VRNNKREGVGQGGSYLGGDVPAHQECVQGILERGVSKGLAVVISLHDLETELQVGKKGKKTRRKKRKKKLLLAPDGEKRGKEWSGVDVLMAHG
jgi:hypothetical protein